jgi:hypothetical protein
MRRDVRVRTQYHKIRGIGSSNLARTYLFSYRAVCYSSPSDGGAPALVTSWRLIEPLV